ncbi:MAG: ABC transporter permease [Bacilli bacterium]|jgi:ABC-type Na+ efflux pump permease subunit
MKNWLLLLKGEVVRLFKYKIMWFGITLSLIWVLILSLSAETEAKALMPFLLVMDTGMMSIILLASSFYYEKQENTIKSLFVAPVSITQLLSAKIVASLLSGIISMALVGVAMALVHGVFINYGLALIYVILSTVAHVALGYIIVFYSVDFMSFLMKYMGLAVLLMVPVLLVLLGIIDDGNMYLAFLSPSFAAQYLIESVFVAKDGWFIALGIAVLAAFPSVLYPLVVYPKFKAYAIRG